MKILIAEDDATSRLILERVLTKWGYDVVSAKDGDEAWALLNQGDAPTLLLLDWVMPGRDGVEICKELREGDLRSFPFYIILLTGKDRKQDIVKGLNAGANDYVTKPFDNDELHARIGVGRRVVELQQQLSGKINELQDALDHIKTLQGILPICAYCKKIRDDQNYWQQVENYISKATDASFSHSICPDCYVLHIKPQMEKLKQKRVQKTLSDV